MMSFCYSMLDTEYVGGAESVRLDLQIGFLHRMRSGTPSLALILQKSLEQ